MNHYYVGNLPYTNGFHIVHKDGCVDMPSDITYIGSFMNCEEALLSAKRLYWQSQMCADCSRDYEN